MNALKNFLMRNSLSYREFAKKIGTSAPTLYGIVNGIRLPSLKIAFRIQKATLNLVSVMEWELDCEDKKNTKNSNNKRKKNG